MAKLEWTRVPARDDLRWRFLAILTTYVVLGTVFLGFNRTPLQVLFVVGATCALDMLMHLLFRERKLLFPLSAMISGMSLSILANYSHGYLVALIPVVFTIASKYAVTFEGRHVFNPTLFGIGASVLLGGGMITPAPAYQWGGSLAMVYFVVTAALVLFVFRIRRNHLILTFLAVYCVALAYRAWLTRWHVPPEMLFTGALTQPAFYLFAFFMMTDPATSPANPRVQMLMGALLAIFDLVLHLKQTLDTIFLAGMLNFTLVLLFRHGRALWRDWRGYLARLPPALPRVATGSAMIALVALPVTMPAAFRSPTPVDFRLVKLGEAETGLTYTEGNILGRVDPKVANMSKWILSLGDAAAVADVDGDGLLDLFLTNMIKADADRPALFRNVSGLRFERVPLPWLNAHFAEPRRSGVPGGAVFFDYDNDGDRDLYVNVAFGEALLLRNRLKEDGRFSFEDVTREAGLDEYTISVAGNAVDLDRDGRLDLVVGNAAAVHLPGYDQPTRYNAFALPEPEHPGDRRMMNVMQRTFHDAANGGEKLFYMNRGGRFERVPAASLGVTQTRWTLDIAAGDLNGDGYPDLYFANDFGPDELYINREAGRRLELIQGRFHGQISRDTYKGMNASLGDLDGNGTLDIYVSNVHERLQAEGSLLFLNGGDVDERGAAAFEDMATSLNALNEKRFGWGAALVDVDRDGRLDILQANGMADDAYDKKSEVCEDYWYWNDKIALTTPDSHGYTDKWADLRGRCIFPYERNRVYLNKGSHFVDVAESVGWDELGNARGMAAADFDNDGDLDVVVTHMTKHTTFYRNDARPGPDGAKRWVGLELRGNGTTCNRDAIGTRVELATSEHGPAQVREVMARNGLSAQGDARLFFGLDRHDGPVFARIHWCGARQPMGLRLDPGSYFQVEQREPAAQRRPEQAGRR